MQDVCNLYAYIFTSHSYFIQTHFYINYWQSLVPYLLCWHITFTSARSHLWHDTQNTREDTVTVMTLVEGLSHRPGLLVGCSLYPGDGGGQAACLGSDVLWRHGWWTACPVLLIHWLDTHFSPSRTGHAACLVRGFSVPLACRLNQNTPLPWTINVWIWNKLLFQVMITNLWYVVY